MQFIVTTHSPIVLLGALDLAQVFTLDGQCIRSNDFNNYTTYDISQILLSDLFDLPTARSPLWDEKIKRRDILLSKSELSGKEKEELDNLERELSHLSFGDTQDDIKTRKLIYEIADQLGIKANE